MGHAGFMQLTPRLELKYLVDEVTAERVRSDVLTYCHPDHASEAEGRAAYEVLSLYFDTPSLAFHHAKQRGDFDRFKLRARCYGGSSAVFLEVKRKTGDVVTKLRAVARPDDWAMVARGYEAPSPDTKSARRSRDIFAQLMAQTGAEPWLLVHYAREAYVSDVDHYARVTFDRQLRAFPTTRWELAEPTADWLHLDRADAADPRSKVVLELKCETVMPEWMRWIIHAHGLARQGFSKYSAGVMAAHAAGLGQGWSGIEEASP